MLDNAKHYYVGRDELEKLLAKGEGWLSGHPQRELIVDRYLKHWRHLTREALERLTADDELDVEGKLETNELEEQSLEHVVVALLDAEFAGRNFALPGRQLAQ